MTNVLDRLRKALADRYTIEREIGSGGMATVYQAQDVKHERQVAMKVLRPELAAALGPERFLQEIKIAANLHHPHILPLYDSGDTDGFLYYVMPFVEGESLRDRLDREKQLAIDDALQVAREVADALSYAHSHGVIHRDIKPENILLESGHAVVADFGIARAIDAAGGDRLTETGVAIGTPAYMSPEQAGGERNLDGRSDLYSLGCVLHEMLAGQPPFTGPTVESLVHQHLTAEPPNVTAIRPSVPAWVAAALERSLAKTPADRFNPVALFGEAISPRGSISAAGSMPLDRVTKRRWMMAGAGIAVAVIIAVIVVMAALPRGSGVRLDPNLVVVAPFRNATDEPALAQLGERAGHWITQGIQQAAVPVTPWDQSLQSWEYVQTEAAAGRVRDPVRALAEETGAGVVISGAVYVVEGDNLEIQVNVTDAEEGRLLGAVEPLRAPRTSESEIITETQQRVMGFLAVWFDERMAASVTGSVRPPSYAAYQSFDDGIAHYQRSAWREAIPYFRRAFELDTTFVTPLFYWTHCHNNLFEWALSDSVVGILERYRDRLSDYDRHWLDHLKARVDSDNPTALRAIRRAAELAPGSKAVYNRAIVAMWSNRPQEAIDALLSLDPERGAMRGWDPYFRILIRSYLALDRYKDALKAAQRYREIFGDDILPVTHEAYALAGLGRLDDVNALVDELLALPEDGLRRGYYVRTVAVYLRRLGHVDAARATNDRAVQCYEALPPDTKSSTAWRYPNYSVALYVADRCEEAYGVVKPLSDEFPENLEYRGFLGVVAACRGDREEALESSRWLETLNRPYLHGSNTAWRSTIAAALGDGELAVRLWRRAMAEGFGELPPGDARWRAFERIRDYPPFQELMRPKE